MKFQIRHTCKNRIRIHVILQRSMTIAQADALEHYLRAYANAGRVRVYERTADAVITFTGEREALLAYVKAYAEDADAPATAYPTGREIQREYQDKLFWKLTRRALHRLLLPAPVRYAITTLKSLKVIARGLRSLAKGTIDVSVLDATAIAVSLLRGNFSTAGSVMFLLDIGDLLEEWTHKKSVDDLARSLSLHIGTVWKKAGDTEVETEVSDICEDDEVVVRMGEVIPFDGVVSDGEAMVNQASLTGESVSVHRREGAVVYAGTLIEEGELTVRVSEVTGESRFEKIVTLIEDSEKLKSAVESRAEHLADRLVPYTLGGTLLTWLVTRNMTKTMAVLMVDFSCALKLSMPVTVLSAIREAADNDVTVKGGKFLEKIAQADTVVFDKTGTLTKSEPTVADIVSVNGDDPDELLRIAACLEEHFPHSIAKAVVNAAKEKHLSHEEMHSKVEYVVAHGISTTIDDKKVIIGSRHFVFQDEKCILPDGKETMLEDLRDEHSHLYLAINGVLAAVICIEDPLRPEATDVIQGLKALGINNIIMMTGDNERTAAAVAKKSGIDRYYAEVLPEDKANYITREKEAGHTVIMVGDGINDSPALSAADVSIALCESAQIAREVADITIHTDDLDRLLFLRRLSTALMGRIHRNYRGIVGFNLLLIVLGIAEVITPATSALLHNSSTVLISMSGMRDLLPGRRF